MKPFYMCYYTEPKLLTKCPVCENELEVNFLHKYSKVHRMSKNGKISKITKYKRDEGSMKCRFLSCSNCSFHTDCDLYSEQYDIHIWQEDNGQFMYVRGINNGK